MTGSSPRSQAQAAAYGSVPTRGSITRQYGTQIGNAENFTKALIGLLQQGPQVGSAYNSAIASQGTVNNAAAQRIAAITGQAPQTLGSQAAVGGMGDSSMGALLARQGAAKAYGAKLPAVAASQGQLARHTLVTAENQALQARQDAYRQSYVSALAQARQNKFSQNLALQQLGLQKQQFQESKRQFNAGQAYRYAALNENRNQFSQSQALQYQEFQQKLKSDLQSGSGAGGKGGLAGLTRNEISGLQSKAYGYVNDTATLHGVPIQVAIRNLQAQGIPRAIAVYTAAEAYGNMTAPAQADFKGVKSVRQPDGTYKNVSTYNGLGYQQALRAYHSSLGSFRQWVRQKQWNKLLGTNRGQGLNPKQRRTQEGRPS